MRRQQRLRGHNRHSCQSLVADSEDSIAYVQGAASIIYGVKQMKEFKYLFNYRFINAERLIYFNQGINYKYLIRGSASI